VPGVHLSTGEISLPGNATDSVDNDDGQLDHSGTQGHSLFSPNGAAGITFSFDPSGLGGSLPKRAGLVWTDGEGATMFEAFDSLGGSLGKIGPINIADSSLQGTDADDKFFGFIHQGGISKVTMSNTAGGIEVDHLQLEVNNLPHSGGSVGHANARFAGNATYRIAAVVYGLSSDNHQGTIAFVSARNSDRRQMTFESAYGGWKRVTGRVLLGPESDYRLILGAPTGSSYYLNSIAIVRDDAMFDFQTAEERAAWEYIGNAHPTSWGIGGPGDFSGVVVGPSPSAGWSLRQRDIALEAQHSYEITYDVKHVHGDPATVNYMRVENLGSVRVGEQNWHFVQNGQTMTMMLQVNTGNEAGNTVTFGSSGDAVYLVDNIRVHQIN